MYKRQDFSKSGVKGIKLDEKSETTLFEIFMKQAYGIRNVLATALIMAIFWITEALPIPVTAMLPFILFPLLGIASPTRIALPGYFKAYSPYMHHLVVLFIGGFTIAEAMKRWNLHKRIALHFIKLIGFSPKRIMFGLMVATAFISMFISNTATTAMMMPIALAILLSSGEKPAESKFGKAVMLGIAYSASIGGIGTLIGTPPNLILAGFADTLLGVKITFAGWLVIGLPLVIVLLPLTYFLLLRIFRFEGLKVLHSKEVIENKLKELGKLRSGELNTLIIFILVALMWILSKQLRIWLHLPWLNDSVIAIIGVLLFYIVPVDVKNWKFTLDWETNVKIPWGTLLLFGGGLALGTALDRTGGAAFIASYLGGIGNFSIIFILFLVVILMDFLTEITSNTASTNMMLPILFAIGISTQHNPLVLMIGGAVAASMAFMLPVATPPNAIVYGTGYIRINDMVKAGFILDIIAACTWVCILYLLRPIICAL